MDLIEGCYETVKDAAFVKYLGKIGESQMTVPARSGFSRTVFGEFFRLSEGGGR